MLTYIQFTANLPVNIVLPPGFTIIDLYLEYVERECYYEDYLDLYRGALPALVSINYRNAINEINIAQLGVPGHPLLQVNPYPWTLIQITANPRQIRYVLVAESAREKNKGTFYYDTTQLIYTPYFNEPCKLFDINPLLNKSDKLIELADNGVLLIDAFPYGLTLNNPIRFLLQTPFFFNDLCARLNLLCGICVTVLKIALIAPLQTSNWIIDSSIPGGGLNICGLIYPLNELTNDGIYDNFFLWSNANTNIPKTTGPAGGNWHTIVPPYAGAMINHYFNGVVLNPNFTIVNIHRKIAITRTGRTYGPKASLIAFALDI